VPDQTTPIDLRSGRAARGQPAACTCRRCDIDHIHLLRDAHYCPSCGQDLLSAPLPAEKRSDIVRGYARALYLLGRRYETALGARRNPVEAMRCYDKAARLGNVAAIERLGADRD
jgi:TPR repeat protein